MADSARAQRSEWPRCSRARLCRWLPGTEQLDSTQRFVYVWRQKINLASVHSRKPKGERLGTGQAVRQGGWGPWIRIQRSIRRPKRGSFYLKNWWSLALRLVLIHHHVLKLGADQTAHGGAPSSDCVGHSPCLQWRRTNIKTCLLGISHDSSSTYWA